MSEWREREQVAPADLARDPSFPGPTRPDGSTGQQRASARAANSPEPAYRRRFLGDRPVVFLGQVLREFRHVLSFNVGTVVFRSRLRENTGEDTGERPPSNCRPLILTFLFSRLIR